MLGRLLVLIGALALLTLGCAADSKLAVSVGEYQVSASAGNAASVKAGLTGVKVETEEIQAGFVVCFPDGSKFNNFFSSLGSPGRIIVGLFGCKS